MKRAVALVAMVLVAVSTPAARAANPSWLPFSQTSEWNSPLPRDAPVDRRSDGIVAELDGLSGYQYPYLATDGGSGVWLGTSNDPAETVAPADGCDLPPGLNPLRIPDDAEPGSGNDSELLVYDQVQRKVVRLWEAVKSGGPGHYSWSACWSSVYFMGSSGLEGDVACQFDCDARNDGWRGLPGSLLTLRYDEVAADVAARSPVQHVVELVSWDNAACHLWPMAGDEGHSDPLLCEGYMLRIKPQIDLSARGLTGGCLAIAQGLQYYGGVIGDTGGHDYANILTVDLENVGLDGETGRWSDLGVTSDCMSGKVSFDDLEVIQGGYDRPPSGT